MHLKQQKFANIKLGLTTNSCDSNRCLHESLEGQSLCKPRLVRGNKIGYRASHLASYLHTNRKKQAIHPNPWLTERGMEGKLLWMVGIQRISFKLDCLHIILTCQQGRISDGFMCVEVLITISLSLAELRQPVVSNLFIGFQVDYCHSTMSRRNNGGIVQSPAKYRVLFFLSGSVSSSIYIADHTAMIDDDDDGFPWVGCTATWYIKVHGKKDGGNKKTQTTN